MQSAERNFVRYRRDASACASKQASICEAIGEANCGANSEANGEHQMAMLSRSVPVAVVSCVLAACVLFSTSGASAEEGGASPQREAASDDFDDLFGDDLFDDLFDEGDELFEDSAQEPKPRGASPNENAAEDARTSGEVDLGGPEYSTPTDAAAPDGAPETAGPKSGPTIDPRIEAMIVKANKRAENIQKVAISMTALSGSTLTKAGVTDFQDIQKLVPNLTIEGGTDTRSTSVRIRGIGSVGSNAGIDPSVGLFIDGVYQGRAGMSMGDLIDIEAVEVLRGPQGTLYGKNTAAGLISVRTLKPSYDFAATTQLVAGNYSTLQTRSSLNIPIVDERVATRLSIYRSTRDGWDRNLFDGRRVNDESKWGVRNKWLLDVDDDVSLLLSADYAKQDSACCVADIITYQGDSLLWRGPNPAVNPNLNPNFEKIGGFFNPDGPDADGNLVDPANPELRNFRLYDERVDVDRVPENEVRIWGVHSDLELDLGRWGFDEWSFNWLSAYRRYDTNSQFDGDFSQYNAVIADTEEHLEQVSSELRLQSPVGEFFDFTAGFFFYYQNHETIGTLGFDQDFADIFFNPFEPLINNDRNRHKTFSYAGYGQFNLNFSEQIRFTGGLRVSHEKKTVRGSQLSSSQIPAAPVSGPNEFRNLERAVTNVSGTAKLQYFPTADMMVYAGFASGFKSGGFNQIRVGQGGQVEFDDEQALSYELGLRSSWLEGMLVFNMSGYFTDYEDFQAQSFDGTGIVVRNAGSFHSYGIESDVMLFPIENLVWRASLGLNITEYQEFDEAENTVTNMVNQAAQFGFAPFTFSNLVTNANSANPSPGNPVPAGTRTTQDLKGKRLDNAPRWSISTAVDYELPIYELPVNWVFHVDYSFRSSIFLNQDLDRNLREPGLNLLALRTGVRSEDEHWELLFWVSNLLDEEYLVAGFDVPVLGGFAGLHGPPRQYGISARLSF